MNISMNDTILSSNSVRVLRAGRQWSQADLAGRAGISRAAVSAIEAERLSPSVATALALAAVLECSVEELFGRGKSTAALNPEWAWKPKTESCRYWEADVNQRRLRYPVEAISAYPIPHDGVWTGGPRRDMRTTLAKTTLTLACCDPAAGGTYYVLSSMNAVQPLNQWTPVAAILLTGNGNFSITATNEVNAGAPWQQFFVLQTQ
jgi:DNA-binding XRE family transcriptional regulator